MQENAHTPVKDATPTGTQTLLRGLGVVQAVAAGARDLKEIARRIGTTRSTTHRLASCLVDERYLRVVPQVGYLLGPKLIELGFQAREELPLVNLAVPYLDELSALTGDTVHLVTRTSAGAVTSTRRRPGVPARGMAAPCATITTNCIAAVSRMTSVISAS